MARKKKQKSKNKKNRIITISVIVAILLILVGCFIWYYCDKTSKQSTIAVREENVNFGDKYWLSFDYDLKGTYKINFDVYEENKKISEQNHFVYLNSSGTCYFMYKNIEPGQYTFDVYKVGTDTGIAGSFTINFNEKYNGVYAPINSKFDSKKKVVLNNKRTVLFEVYPFEKRCFEGFGCGSGTDSKTKIVATIKKVEEATDYDIEGIE